MTSQIQDGDPEDPATLRHKVEELQQQVRALEEQLGDRLHPRTAAPVSLKKIAVPLLLILATLALAGVLPALVIRHRWAFHPEMYDLLRSFFCGSAWLCRFQLPGYFWVALVCLVLAAVLVFILPSPPPEPSSTGSLPAPFSPSKIIRKASFWLLVAAGITWLGSLLLALARGASGAASLRPGWEMALVFVFFTAAWIIREVPLRSFGLVAWKKRSLIAALVLFCGALPLFLRSFSENTPFQWIYALLLLAAGLNVLRFLPLPPIFWILLLIIPLSTFRIDDWRLAAVGDEYSFYSVAREIVERPDLAHLSERLFDGAGVYGTHPYFSSVLQSFSMSLFGTLNFGWRFSNILAVVASVGLFYVFLFSFASRRIALAGAVLLGTSHYLLVFGKIGYNNLQALMALLLSLAAAAWAVRRRSNLAYAATGLAAGLCFYVYPAALYAVPLPFLLLFFLDRPWNWKGWLLAAGSLLLAISPLLLQPAYWLAKIPGTFLFNAQVTSSPGNIFFHFVSNTFYALFSFLYIPEESHFVVSSYLDPISGLFAVLGLALCIKWIIRAKSQPSSSAFFGFWITSFAWMLISVGASHDRGVPSTTRMFLLLPWFVLFAVLGIDWLAERLKQLVLPRQAPSRVLGVVVGIALLANLYMAFSLSPERNSGQQSLEILFLRTERELNQIEPDWTRTYFVITDSSWSVDGLLLLQKVYPGDLARTRLVRVPVNVPELPAWFDSLAAERSSLVILQPWLDENWKKAINSRLEETKQSCAILAESGDERFVLWHSPELPFACQSR